MRALDPSAPRRILVRATNWVGDAVMSLPALEELARLCPQADVAVLAKPVVAPVYAAAPSRPGLVICHPAVHGGLAGRLALAGSLRPRGFDWAVLFQNAFGAALVAWLARVPVRLGYAADARRPLLTHPVARRPAVRRVHETSYYLHLLHAAGLAGSPPPAGGVRPRLDLPARESAQAGELLAGRGLEGARLLGLAPGAAYGPAKCWPAERFASAAAELVDRHGLEAVLLLGGPDEAPACAAVEAGLAGRPVHNLAGETSLGQALALLDRVGLFITNDSGLMHAAAALGTPTVAVFGSTNPVTTGPLGPRVAVVRRPPECAPCLRTHCPTDLRCFTAIGAEEVAQAGAGLLEAGR
jgi:heptosyltransferase-2